MSKTDWESNNTWAYLKGTRAQAKTDEQGARSLEDEGEIAAGDPAAVQEWLEKSYTCPRCGKVSHHPEDLKHRYCAACHQFESL